MVKFLDKIIFWLKARFNYKRNTDDVSRKIMVRCPCCGREIVLEKWLKIQGFKIIDGEYKIGINDYDRLNMNDLNKVMKQIVTNWYFEQKDGECNMVLKLGER
jgi:hypothetical protein